MSNFKDLVDSDIGVVPKHVLEHFFRCSHYKTFTRSLEFIVTSYIDKPIGYRDIQQIIGRISSVWEQMYCNGMVDCPPHEMPRYIVGFENNCVVFDWSDEI